MYIVVVAWLYVALMMAAAEAVHPAGSVLGAVVTFVLYGAAPVALVTYVLRTPTRRRAAREREAQEQSAARAEAEPNSASQPDERRHAAGGPVAPE